MINKLKNRKCSVCGEAFKTRIEKREFCKQKCFREWRKKDYSNDVPDNEILKEFNLFIDKNGTLRGGKCFTKNHKTNNGRNPWNKDKKECQKAWNRGLKMKNYYDAEQYEKFIKGCIKGGVACQLKLADNSNRTSIEIALEEIVEDLGIKYMTQYPLLGITVADLYLPDKHIAIYADGDYWHNYPHGTKKDHEVNKDLANANIKVLRFWECHIKEDIFKIKKIISEAQRL